MTTRPSPAQWNGLKRTPFPRRKPAVVRLPDGMKIAGKPWPAAWMSEKDWQENVISYAFHGDRGLKYWHCTTTKTSHKGWFDLALFQPNRRCGILAELKVRDKEGRSKSPSTYQWEFIAAAGACGYDVRSWQWPDDAEEAWTTLTGMPYSAAQWFNGRMQIP